MGTQMGIQVEFQTEASALKAKIDIPQQGAKGLDLKNVRFEPPKVHFELASPMAPVTFEGELKNGEIAGTFAQGNATGSFSLKRSSEKPAAVEPLPYKEEEVKFVNGSVSLAGTLTLPANGKTSPAVVLITGSGAQNRDEEIFGFKPFRLIADHLTRNGIAVLRYDDRGVGGSTGSVSDSTTQDFAGDVLAAVQLLVARPDIDPKHIGLLGHSEGGIVAPIAASRSKDIAFIILMSGTAVTGEKIMLAQGEAIAKAAGAPAEDLQKQADLQKRIFQCVRSAKGWEELRAYMTKLGMDQIAEMPEEQRKKIPDPQAVIAKTIDAQLKPTQSTWFKYFLDFDPAGYLEKVRCPVLATFGELDLQVPTEMNRQAMVAAFEKGGNKDYTIQIFPKANHLYLSAGSGSPAEYATLKKEFVPGFLDFLTKWIRAKSAL
jgi:uncharacterized protein